MTDATVRTPTATAHHVGNVVCYAALAAASSPDYWIDFEDRQEQANIEG
jgi:hypothetical protein